jgi:hypothetical protein
MISKDNKVFGARGTRGCSWRHLLLGACVVLVYWLVLAAPCLAQTDICGCMGNPASLGRFDTEDASTWPAGTTVSWDTITIPLPPDGIFIFDSFRVRMTPDMYYWARVKFGSNAANTPVTILVSGDVTIEGGYFDVSGESGQQKSSYSNGKGGLGGPGGFRGGDGAFQALYLTRDGAAGLGPLGGAGGTVDPYTNGANGQFLGAAELRPLVGGSGGGGGASAGEGTDCGGAGGGGGGGAILIAANGTIFLTSGGIYANGGGWGYSWGCGSWGGLGSGGAVRLVAHAVSVTGGYVYAYSNAGDSSKGSIRIEAIDTSNINFQYFSPTPRVIPWVGPLTNPFVQYLNFTSINGQQVPATPQGAFGKTDVTLPVAGPTTFQLESKGVPGGTGIEVTAKPRLGGQAVAGNVTIDPYSCDSSGTCTSSLTLDLPAGAYTAEARATFTVQ